MANILIGGGSGFVGGFLSKALQDQGHQVRHLSRRARPDAAFPTFQWDVSAGTIDEAAFADLDYVINLAGAGIADKPWSARRKKLIIDSRVQSNALLASTLQRIAIKPKLYLSASAIGYYGNAGETLVDETSPAGTGFLSESTLAWEDSVQAITEQNIPLFVCRIGIVLHPSGGALEKMLLPMKVRNSTYFGNGKQWYSWIHMADLVGIFLHAIEHQLTGTYNAVAPHPARNKTLAAEIPEAMGKPAFVLPAPSFALKLTFGEMAHTILDSCKVSSEKISQAGYAFRFPDLPLALEDLLAE